MSNGLGLDTQTGMELHTQILQDAIYYKIQVISVFPTKENKHEISHEVRIRSKLQGELVGGQGHLCINMLDMTPRRCILGS